MMLVSVSIEVSTIIPIRAIGQQKPLSIDMSKEGEKNEDGGKPTRHQIDFDLRFRMPSLFIASAVKPPAKTYVQKVLIDLAGKPAPPEKIIYIYVSPKSRPAHLHEYYVLYDLTDVDNYVFDIDKRVRGALAGA